MKGGMPGNLQGLMQQAKLMQDKLKKTQEEAKNMTAESSTGGGMVKVKVNGDNQVESLEIDPQAINPDDKEMLQDMITLAINNALTEVQEAVKAEVSKATGGMNIPGLF